MAIAEHFDEAADYVEVLRRLWDSWEDDAEIRDVATGRFIDRDKLHYIDFEGRWFSVKGPSITPRPPQGQPVVRRSATASVPYRLIARSADVGFVTPRDAAQAAAIVAEIRPSRAAGRDRSTVHVFGRPGGVPRRQRRGGARRRKERLDERAGDRVPQRRPRLHRHRRRAGRPAAGLAGGRASGFRLRPAPCPTTSRRSPTRLVPELQRRGAFRHRLRGRHAARAARPGPPPANRYAAA